MENCRPVGRIGKEQRRVENYMLVSKILMVIYRRKNIITAGKMCRFHRRREEKKFLKKEYSVPHYFHPIFIIIFSTIQYRVLRVKKKKKKRFNSISFCVKSR